MEDSTLAAVDLTADVILSAQDERIEPVDVPEWGGRVYVKSLSGSDRERYIESIHALKGKGKAQTRELVMVGSSAKLVALACCTKTGERLFTDDQVAALGQKSAKALQRVVDAAAELNALGEEAAAAVGNDSGSARTDGSSSV